MNIASFGNNANKRYEERVRLQKEQAQKRAENHRIVVLFIIGVALCYLALAWVNCCL